MSSKARIAFTIGVVMLMAFVFFVRGVVLIFQDYSRPDIPKGENTLGFIVVSLLACAAAFEAYRFLHFFFDERRERRAMRHFN